MEYTFPGYRFSMTDIQTRLSTLLSIPFISLKASLRVGRVIFGC
jgi:hypothetical protein